MQRCTDLLVQQDDRDVAKARFVLTLCVEEEEEEEEE